MTTLSMVRILLALLALAALVVGAIDEFGVVWIWLAVLMLTLETLAGKVRG